MQSYNFFGQSPGQQLPSQDPALLAQQMQLTPYNNPTSANAQPSPVNGMGAANPQSLAKMMMPQQYAPGYTDSAGVSGQTLAANGISPGASSNMFGMGGMSMFGGAGNPLNMSSGNQFSPQDLAALQGAFNG